MLLHRCVYCLTGNSAEVRFDKRGKPYTTCRACGSRAFFQSIHACRGLAVMPELLEEAMRRRAADPEYCREFDGKIAAMVSEVSNALAAPASVPRSPVAGNMDRPLMEPFMEAK
jgi:hypothetical protein